MFGITWEMLFLFLIKLIVLFTAFPVHEYAHGIAADKLGDDTPYSQGRLTLNPFAHLDFAGSILLFLTGFGWARPVEVNISNLKNPRRDMALISLAGPFSNILMAFLTMIIYKLLLGFMPAYRFSSYANTLSILFEQIIYINISLAVFNLLPLPPLDGSKIFGALLPKKLYWGMLRNQRAISIVIILLLITGIIGIPISFATRAVYGALDAATVPVNLLFR